MPFTRPSSEGGRADEAVGLAPFLSTFGAILRIRQLGLGLRPMPSILGPGARRRPNGRPAARQQSAGRGQGLDRGQKGDFVRIARNPLDEPMPVVVDPIDSNRLFCIDLKRGDRAARWSDAETVCGLW
jgi:hypothetical protein